MKFTKFAFALVLLLASVGCNKSTQQVTEENKAAVPVSAPAAATAPPLAYTARTDKSVVQLPNPLPGWGGATGAGTCQQDSRYPGSTTCRLTDATFARVIKLKGTLQTADSGEPQLGSSDGLHVIVRDNGAYSYVIGFNPHSHVISKTGIGIANASPSFSDKNPSLIWTLKGTQIHALTASADWSTASDTVLYDYANAKCLGVGFKSTWNAIFTVSDDDATFKTAFSNTGGQGSGVYTVSYNNNTKVCSVYNSFNGSITNNGVAAGTVTIKDRFYLHEAGNGRDPNYALVTATQKTDKGKPGCVAGTCLVDQPYVWQIGTTNLMRCTNNCQGHSTKGVAGKGFYVGKKQAYQLYSAPNTPATQMVNFPAGFPDQHGSAHNQVTTQPLMLSSTGIPVKLPYPVWGYDEILGVASDGSQTVYRFGQTLNTGTSPYFICANAIAVVDQLGTVIYFTSDMGGHGMLGYEADGKTSRCDVFALIPTAK